jgi:hypothetical protein
VDRTHTKAYTRGGELLTFEHVLVCLERPRVGLDVSGKRLCFLQHSWGVRCAAGCWRGEGPLIVRATRARPSDQTRGHQTRLAKSIPGKRKFATGLKPSRTPTFPACLACKAARKGTGDCPFFLEDEGERRVNEGTLGKYDESGGGWCTGSEEQLALLTRSSDLLKGFFHRCALSSPLLQSLDGVGSGWGVQYCAQRTRNETVR